MKNVYMDYAAATPLSKRVLWEMIKYELMFFANPSSIYPLGKTAKEAVEEARKRVARCLHGRAEEVVFVSGGTESINLAIQGAILKARKDGISNPEMITTKIEHSAVLETAKFCEAIGLVKIKYLEVDEDGLVNPKDVEKKITPNTVLISIGYANNEIGVVQDIPEIGATIQKFRKEKVSKYPLFHTDAAQAPNYLSIDRDHLKVDLMSLDASKIYGPKGAGVLFIRNGVEIESLIHGGGQERGVRAGTEAVSQIIGMSVALEQTLSMREEETRRLRDLQSYFIGLVQKELKEARVIGSRKSKIPNNVHICIPKINSEFITIALGEKGIMVSPGAACGSNDEMPRSHVLEALGLEECASSSLRFTLGRGTKKSEIDYVIHVLKKLLAVV